MTDSVGVYTDAEWAYVILPSEKAAFRKGMAELGEPFETHRPAYRVPAERFPDFTALASKHYPNWAMFRTVDAPPWALEGIMQFRVQIIADGLRVLGLECKQAIYEDRSIHLHTRRGDMFACLVFGRYGFRQAYLGDHSGVVIRDLREILDLLGFPEVASV